jgi:hypothetical protein
MLRLSTNLLVHYPLTELATFGWAIVADHVGVDLSSGQVQDGRGHQKSLPLVFGRRLNPASSSNYLRGVLSSGGPDPS